MASEENGTFTDQGYVHETREAFHEYYNGERASIPDEYRVMTFKNDLSEEEKSDWAMDIAFDMDVRMGREHFKKISVNRERKRNERGISR